MKSFLQDLRLFWQQRPATLALVLLVLIMGLFFGANYAVNFKRIYMSYGGSPWDLFKYFRVFLFFFAPLSITWLLFRHPGKVADWLGGAGASGKLNFPLHKDIVPWEPNSVNNASEAESAQKQIWLFLVFAALAYAVSVSFNPQYLIIKEYAPRSTWVFWMRMANFGLRSGLMIAIPFVWWYWQDRGKVPAYYGFRWSPGKGKLYLILLAIALAGTFLAAQTPDFSRYYPMYKPGREAEVLGVSRNVLFGLWQFNYAINFVAVEFFFRGFMVMALGRIIGPSAIWVMASMYMFIHFGKPPGEALSSFFGGLLLGVLSYRTGSILGGIILHVGIALGMDYFALF